MIEFILFLCLSTVIQAAILRIWFDSTLFEPVQNYLQTIKDRRVIGFFAKLLSCYQCFGAWMGFAVVWGLTYFSPYIPFSPWNIPCVFMFGLATGLLSEILDLFVLSKLRG